MGLKTLWANHKTKLIGGVTTLLGALSEIDANTAHYIEEFIGPHWGHRVASGLMAAGGLATFWAGLVNSRKYDAGPK